MTREKDKDYTMLKQLLSLRSKNMFGVGFPRHIFHDVTFLKPHIFNRMQMWPLANVPTEKKVPPQLLFVHFDKE